MYITIEQLGQWEYNLEWGITTRAAIAGAAYTHCSVAKFTKQVFSFYDLLPYLFNDSDDLNEILGHPAVSYEPFTMLRSLRNRDLNDSCSLGVKYSTFFANSN